MKIESRNEGRGILIHRQILSVDEYRKLSGLSPGKEGTLSSLKQQLEEPSEPGKDFWWSPVTDLEFLRVKAVEGSIKTALVTDGKAVIICELPNAILREMFVEAY